MCLSIKSRIFRVLLFFSLHAPLTVFAATIVTPSDVYSKSEMSNRLIDDLLNSKGIAIPTQLPVSQESSAQPMHVYEIATAILQEMYEYALQKKISPPPIVVSTPIRYTPEDVLKVADLINEYLVTLQIEHGTGSPIYQNKFLNKKPIDVYQNMLELYFKISLFRGQKKISPNQVYSQASRIKNDLRTTMLTLARNLDNDQERTKRLLYTAAYGINIDGSAMSKFEENKKPRDVLKIAFKIRELTNKLRDIYNLKKLKIPNIKNYREKILPIDVFLQTQFIIAEINVLKAPLNLYHTMNRKSNFENKNPSHVYHEFVHIKYMLERLINHHENSRI